MMQTQAVAHSDYQRTLDMPNWPLLHEADFSGTLSNWRSESLRLPAPRQPGAMQSVDLDRILAYAG